MHGSFCLGLFDQPLMPDQTAMGLSVSAELRKDQSLVNATAGRACALDLLPRIENAEERRVAGERMFSNFSLTVPNSATNVISKPSSTQSGEHWTLNIRFPRTIPRRTSPVRTSVGAAAAPQSPWSCIFVRVPVG